MRSRNIIALALAAALALVLAPTGCKQGSPGYGGSAPKPAASAHVSLGR